MLLDSRLQTRLRKLLVPLATLPLAVACGDEGTTAPPPETGTITLDARLHLLESPESTTLTTTLSEEEIQTVIDRVNQVWAQADILFRIESVVRERARNVEEFEAFRRGEADLDAAGGVMPTDNLTGDDWDVFFIRELAAGAGGVYFPGLPAILQPEVDPFGVRGPDGALVRLLAHELGHSLGLGHVPCPPQGNLMAPNCPGADRTRLEPGQVDVARSQAATDRPFAQGGPIGWQLDPRARSSSRP